MSAPPAAPESEPATLNHGSHEQTPSTVRSQAVAPGVHYHKRHHHHHRHHDPAVNGDGDSDNVPIKCEHVDSDPNTTNTTATTLRPSPQPSVKRRESRAAEVDALEIGDKLRKKRKRVASPPWQFGTVEVATVKSVDGRRVSARVNTGTPVLSESESRPRSASQSASRSRPSSPPWKKFQAEGPASIQVGGVRKSGRVNKDLSESTKLQRTSPRHKKIVSKLATEVKTDDRPMSRGQVLGLDGITEPMPKKVVKSNREQSPTRKIAELQAQIAALKPTNSFPSPEHEVKPSRRNQKRKRSSESHEGAIERPPSPVPVRKIHRPSNVTLSPEVTRPSPRIKLRFGGGGGGGGAGVKHGVPSPHPQAEFSPPVGPPRLSLHQVIEEYELLEMQQPYIENENGPPDAAEFRRRHEKQAQAEGEMRRRLLAAIEPGGTLSKENVVLYENVEQEEPSPQYGHGDHLSGHALFFRQLQLREKTNHRLLAKKVAYEALEYWKARRGPTEDDLRAEEDKIFRLVYKQVVLDMRGKWEMVANHVQQLKREEREAEDAARLQEKLQKQLEQAEAMFAKQRGENEGEDDVDNDTSDDDDVEDVGAENMTESESGESEGDAMSDDALAAYVAQRDTEPPDISEDEQQSEREDGMEEQGTTVDEGHGVFDGKANNGGTAKTADLLMPDVEDDDGGDENTKNDDLLMPDLEDNDAEDERDDYQPAINEAEILGNEDTMTRQEKSALVTVSGRSRRSLLVETNAEQQAVEAELSDDESVDMNSEDYDSDEDMSSSDDDVEAGSQEESDRSSVDQEDDVELSTIALYLDRKEIKAIGLPTPTTSAEGDERDHAADVTCDANPILHAEPGAVETDRMIKEEAPETERVKASAIQDYAGPASPLPDDFVDPDSAPRSPSPDMQSDTGMKSLIPMPTLLRGQLRSYQHAGLDWLASLYRNGTNGILADEMGLGKTIQTISLLAHLAEEHGVWETHLVIVPTSVILNWVTEFQKFLPGFRVLGYYGSAEERAIKRRGWVNDPHHEDRSKRGYNVVITSYNVAMQDINAIRNVQWHYLVLDEAHNIRNFNSQRWQVLIRLKTVARLLLTGTPLQNSLTELWSLLTFLTAGDDNPQHGGLEEFLSHWKEPVKEIFDRGVSTLSTEAQKVVEKLHVSLRPFLLRRLKSEVEKDLPKKTESVVVCKLSKRQRQLYQEYMGLASTKESLSRGNAVSAGKVLLSLRRVCNHPDLFDPRPIQTSFAMGTSPLESFSVEEVLLRRLLGPKEEMSGGMLLAALEDRRSYATKRSRQLVATPELNKQVRELETAMQETVDVITPAGCLALQRLRQRERKLRLLRDSIRVTTAATKDLPIYGSDLRELVTMRKDRSYTYTQRARLPQESPIKLIRGLPALGRRALQVDHLADWLLSKSTMLQRDILTIDRYADNLHDIIERFAFSPPVVTAPVLDYAIPPHAQKLLRASSAYPTTSDYGHEARIRTSIAFPDSRLLMYDSGKLQRLSDLLRDLQARGSRSLIFTQMTGTLNILEQFLSLLNLPYLRLDGSTPVEKRQLYSSEFNRPDSKYQCMILSSRAGGVGLNLVGASSVIFYDLDWNPQMDRQCMDRAHRIGQVRDVEVYKMVSEKTVEENILRRANQKSLLDQTVIQQGHFTTEYQQPARRITEDAGEAEDDVAAAIERFLGGGEKASTHAIESVEDKEDVAAAQQARKEEHQDDVDFAERSSKGASAAATPGPVGTEVDSEGGDDEGRKGHVDDWMVRWMQEMKKGQAFMPLPIRRLDKHGRDPSHRPKRKR